jgi:phage-related protein
VTWDIVYPYPEVKRFVLQLPPTLLAKYLKLAGLMIEFGSNLGMPHTRAMSGGLFELRISGREGIARVLFCTLAGQRIIMLHAYSKKTQETPPRELRIARKRMREFKENDAR